MKKLLLSVLLLCTTQLAIAQIDSALRFRSATSTFEAAVDANLSQIITANPTDTLEGSQANEFSRYSEFLSNHICRNVPVDSDMYLPGIEAMTGYMLHAGDFCGSSPVAIANWQCTGPFVSYYGHSVTEYEGRVDNVYGDPMDTNHILATGNMGGLWETHNQGITWHNITDNAPLGYSGGSIPGTIGIPVMAVDPLNMNNIYLLLGVSGASIKSWGYNLGVIYTTDEGASWQLDTAYNNILGISLYGGYPSTTSFEMKYMPGTEKLFVYNSNRVLVKSGIGGGAWTEITPTGLPAGFQFNDMDFSKEFPGKVVFTGNNISTLDSYLWLYDTATATWSTLSVSLPSVTDTITKITALSVSGMDTAFIIVNGHMGATRFSYLAKTSIYSDHVTVVSNSCTYQQLIVSPLNQNIIYGRGFAMSTDGGYTFTEIDGNSHADHRGLSLYKYSITGDSDICYGGTDGGVVMKRAGKNYFESITGDSLCITQFYGFTNTEGDADIMEGGAQDNGGFTYIKSRTPAWHNEISALGGDNFLAKFANNGKETLYTENNFPGLESVTFSGTSYSMNGSLDYPNPPYGDAASPGCPFCYSNNNQRPFYFDQNNTAYVGYRQVWKQDITASLWVPAFNTTPLPDSVTPKVLSIQMAENNNNFVVLAFRDGGNASYPIDTIYNQKLFYTKNGQDTVSTDWKNITPSEVIWNRMNDMIIDPLHPGRIWVVYGDIEYGSFTKPVDSMQNRVWYSPDTGTTWYDVSSGLSSLPANKILYRKGSNDELFCGTDIGVYRCDFSTFDPTNPPFYNVHMS